MRRWWGPHILRWLLRKYIDINSEKLPCKDVMNQIKKELFGQGRGVALIFGNERNGLTASEMESVTQCPEFHVHPCILL